MLTLKEIDDDEDSRATSNVAEVEDDEHDLLIEKSDTSQMVTMANNETRLGIESSNKQSSSFSQLSNIKRLLPSKLHSYFNNNNSTTNHRNYFSDNSIKQSRKKFSRTISDPSSHSIRASQRFYHGFSNLAKKKGDFSLNNNCDNDYDDDDLLRCIKTRGHKSSIRKKCHIFFTLLIALTLLFIAIYLLIKLLILIEEHKNLLEYQQNDWKLLKFISLSRAKSSSGEKLFTNEAESSRWLISSPKCHIPAIDPWHESIKSYVELKNDVDCHKISKDEGFPANALSYVHDNKLFLNKQVLKSNNNNDRNNGSLFTDCCYREISRSDDNDDDLIYNETCNRIKFSETSALTIPFELIKLECPKNNYTNYHSFILHDLEEEEAFKRIAEKKLNTEQYYNVLLIGMDTISRLNGYRQLNKTLDLLKKTYKTLEFYGYNKVGENTFPNLIPLLTGLKPTQLTETQCWLPTNYTDEGESGDDYLDNCKYLWNYYQELGYVTYFSEDWSTFSTFNYLKPGFRRKPTLFYGRPFAKARKSLLLPTNRGGCSTCLLDKPTVEVDLERLKNFIKEQRNAPHFALHWMNCPQHDDLNGASQVDSIVRKFFQEVYSLVNERSFIIFFSDHGYRWNDFVSTRIGHYEASLPLLTIAPPRNFIDKHPELYENLKRHQKSLLTPFDLFKTLIAIRNLGAKSLKQHQRQQQQLQDTQQKPRGFSNANLSKINYSPNKDGNMEHLVETAFDSSPTATTTVEQLHQVDGLSYRQDFKILSLLDKHSNFELDRSCIDAGIPDNYCVCHEFNETNPNSLDVKGAAFYLVYVHLYNQIRESQDICELLDLDTINESQMFDFKRMKSLVGKTEQTSRRRRKRSDDKNAEQETESSSQISKNVKGKLGGRTTLPPQKATSKEIVIDEHHFLPNREYNIRITTKPGLGLFQEVVRYYGDHIGHCESHVKRAKHLLKNPHKTHREKYEIVMEMNKVCKFSVHSDSISRLNLYKGQSDCVSNNIELKKICYCKQQ